MKKLLLSALVLILSCVQLTRVNAQSNFIRQDSIFSQVRNCQAGVSICIDSFTYDDIADYRFFLDGAPYTATIDPCRVDTIHAYSYLVLFQDGETGPFSLESWQVNSRTFSMNFANLSVLRDSMRVWDPSGNWILDDAAQIIYGVATGGTSYSCQNILGLTRGGRNEVCYNPGLLFKGIRFDIPVGVRMFVAENIITGDRDTVRLYASCVTPDTIVRNITVGENGNYCVNTSELLGTVRSINNFCFGTTQFANFQTPSGTCISYSGIARGRDTACLRFCDQYGVCDTTILIVNVSNPTGFRNHIFRDTIRIDSVKQKCDITIPSGTISSFQNLCVGSSGTNVNFSLDNMTRCVTYRGVTEGVDTACVAVCNSTGLCDTTYFYIVTLPNPAPPQGVSVRRTDTITTGLSRQQCAWLSVPSGGTIASIQNICTTSGTFATFTLDTPSRCVTYRGVTAVGTDSICYRVCNTLGTCDTTKIVINTLEPTRPLQGITVQYIDTIALDSSRERCNLTRLTNVRTVENMCLFGTGTSTLFTLRPMPLCVSYRAIDIGVDSACIRVCDANGTCDTINYRIVVVPSVPQGQVFRVVDTVRVDSTKRLCNITRLTRVRSITNFCPSQSGTFANFTIDAQNQCVQFRGLSVGRDSACVQVCDSLGTCDTIYYTIVVIPNPIPAGQIFRVVDTVRVDSTKRLCNITRLSNVTGITNFCASQSGTFANFTIDAQNQCVQFRGLSVGRDSACVRVCNAAGTCDTIYYTIIVVPNPIPAGQIFRVVDTVRVDSTKRLCNITRLTNVTGITNFCPSQSGTFANFTIDAPNQCVQFRGLSVGTDSACVQVCNAAGTCDTIYYKIVVVPNPNPIPVGQIFRVVDTVRVDSTKRLCNITRLTNVTGITNFCPSQSGTFANFTIDAPNQCVQFRGLSVGTDSACVQVCNAAGTCDTIYYKIVVVPNPNPIPVGQIFRVVDTVRVDSTKRLCNITRLSNVTGITNFCPSQSGTFANFTIDAPNQCVQFRGLRVGTDSACVQVCNAVGTCDTIYYKIVVVPNPAPSVGSVFYMVDTIFVDSLKQRCSYSRLPNITSVRNFCQTASGLNALFTIEPVTNCLIYRGLEVGVDSACLQVCDASGVCDTIYYRIVVRNLPPVPRRIYRLYDTIYVNDSVRYCNLVAPQGANSISNYCAASSGTFANFALDNVARCVTYRGVAVGQDSACIVVCSPANGCDTTIMHITIIARPRPTPSVDSITLRVLENGGYCLDTTEISWRPINRIGYCLTPNLRHSSVRIDSTRFCVNVNATSSGRDTICMQVCNTEGVCDTTTLYIIVRPDTVRVELKIDTVRIVLGRDTVYAGVDTTQIRGSVDTIYNICPLSSGANATVGINRNNNTLNIRSLTVGWDTACIVVCNRTSFLCDTTIVYIQVIDSARAVPRPRPSVDSITFRLGTDTTFCRLDLAEIGGAPDTIYNICHVTTNRAAILNINRTSNCLILNALAVGVDTACMVVCNRTTGLCDTTTVYIRVIPSNVADSIIATDDSATVQAGRPLILNLFGNDTIRSTVTFFDFIFRPSKGTADTLSRGLIRYNPNVGACGLDSFRYIVCTGRYCDTATVRITIPCTGNLVAFNAISPNDDGMNDRFIIQGLDNYPNHELCIFSRWGTQVLNTQNYQQDWQGRWEGKDLPDGTYFYLLRNLDDNAILLSGFLQIAR